MLLNLISRSKPLPAWEGDEDLPALPRATELLIELRRERTGISWLYVISTLLYCAIAILYLTTVGTKDPMWLFWLAMAALFLALGRVERHKKREKLMIELLGELVSQNNQLRRNLEPTDKRESQDKSAQ